LFWYGAYQKGELVKKKLRVRKSGISGRGLFASKKIRRGVVLGVCKTRQTETPNDYTLWTSTGPLDVVCRLRFINHSVSPNVAYYEDDLSVVALRNIKAGEELTHDYGDDWR
jgi:hypothetical protein